MHSPGSVGVTNPHSSTSGAKELVQLHLIPEAPSYPGSKGGEAARV